MQSVRRVTCESFSQVSMMKYHELLKIVNPKRAKVAEMNAQLDVVRARLAEKMKLLRAVEERMAQLEATYQEKLENERALVCASVS